MKTIEIFVGNVTQIKQGDLLLIKSMLVEVTNVVHETFTVKIEAITNEGDSKEYTFSKEVFLNI